MSTETRILPDGTLVQRVQIIGTERHTYTAWRPRTPAHRTLMTHAGASYGKIGSDVPPPWVDEIYTDAAKKLRQIMNVDPLELHAAGNRQTILQTWRVAQDYKAYEAIHAAFPEAFDDPTAHIFSGGVIT
jgi:hypothetical protein